jgi:hypothetical protein
MKTRALCAVATLLFAGHAYEQSNVTLIWST